jgi:hypothetical protein
MSEIRKIAKTFLKLGTVSLGGLAAHIAISLCMPAGSLTTHPKYFLPLTDNLFFPSNDKNICFPGDLPGICLFQFMFL